jgi:hypothetical protein
MGLNSSKSTLDIKNFAPKRKVYSDEIQIFFLFNGQFSKIFVNLRKSKHYFRKHIVDFCKSYRFYPFSTKNFERLDSNEILKFCVKMSWRWLASELQLKPKRIQFLFSFLRNVVKWRPMSTFRPPASRH